MCVCISQLKTINVLNVKYCVVVCDSIVCDLVTKILFVSIQGRSKTKVKVVG